ncbi:MAG: hypoxanthine phosphoribosyltransferase, partial [Erysipelotrichaceae bacterium]|nr:hypoxanthine phosphoribosyltransferase [Erysipelotrichaceae bacterium]
MMRDDVKKVLFTEQEITERCRQLGKQITEDYKDRGNDLLIVGILKGSLPFFAELIKYIDLYVDIDFMIVSSYEGTESSGSIKISRDLGTEAEGRDLLVVEDIVDTGLTLSNL